MTASVRAAVPEDAEAIVDVHEAAWDAGLGSLVGMTLGQLAPRVQRVERMRAGLEAMPPDAVVLVGVADERIVGMAVGRHADGEAGDLRDLYVHPSAWGSGLATDLLNAALDSMRGRDAAEAGLWVVADNRRARRFYEPEGWTVDGQERITDLGPAEVHYRRDIRRSS
jgi:GNAT superfamily N-acetyltransferase